MMVFPDKHASTTDSLDMCHSESGLGRRLLREKDSSWGVCNAALDKMIQPQNETSASLTLLLTGLPPQESSWAFAKHVMAAPDSIKSSPDNILSCCKRTELPHLFLLAKLRNM